MRIGLGLFCLVVGCGVSAAQTPVTQSETLDIHHYEVSGLSPEHLIESFRNRPDPTVVATTRSGVDIRYEFAFGQGECRLMQIDLTLDIDITYPRWREEAQGSASMQAEWARFMAAVEAHEHGHVERFRAAVSNLSDQLAAIPPAASCDVVRDAVDRSGEQFDRALEAAQAAYERETNNGATQGARLRFR
jgi:predicted secreted Zn-dependent protease